jgi:hypothetical protein
MSNHHPQRGRQITGRLSGQPIPQNEANTPIDELVQCVVMRHPPKLGVSTLCRLMDDCLPEQIDDERDMQRLIDKLWPALCCEFEIDA